MRILFVDDQPDTVELASRAVFEEFGGEEPEILTSFELAEDCIATYRPDIVVLDLLRVSPQGSLDPEGLGPLHWIWKSHFMPIVIYSAEPERALNHETEMTDHPLIKLVKKGAGSDLKVVDQIRKLVPAVRSLQTTRLMVDQNLSTVLKEVAPMVFEHFGDEDEVANAIGRASMRRLAAMADEQGIVGNPQAAWEQYLFPPLSPDLRLGDVLRVSYTADLAPDQFRVVLTPSCDLVDGVVGNAKARSVLVAKCCSNAEGMRRSGIQGTRRPDRIQSRMLSQGYLASIIPVPALQDMIPSMMADLTDLELIPISDVIRTGNGHYHVVASMDSPFRELVSWAYLQSAGRPGLPDRDLDSWSHDIVASAKQEQSS